MALREIRKYQIFPEMLIRKVPFMRLVHEIVLNVGHQMRWQQSAMAHGALQEAAEAQLFGMMDGEVLL